MDAVFQALNDPSRRLLLDRLFARDGQTLSELCEHLPGMTRQGVMNHLQVLEDGGLVTTEKVGRRKFHYLNPVPIREVHDRWISKYRQPWVAGLARLKDHLEHGGSPMSVPDHVYETHVRCTPAAAWEAITDGERTAGYYYGTRVESDWSVGAPIVYRYPDGSVAADGEVLAIDPGTRVEMTFHPRWDEQLEQDGPTRMVWHVDDVDGLTRIRVELHDLGTTAAQRFPSGMAYIVSGMKTLLETGDTMRRPATTAAG